MIITSQSARTFPIWERSHDAERPGCGPKILNNYNVYIPNKILMLSLMSVNKLVHRLLLAIAGKMIVRNKSKEL